jgi:hypothetical protein
LAELLNQKANDHPDDVVIDYLKAINLATMGSSNAHSVYKDRLSKEVRIKIIAARCFNVDVHGVV